MRSWRLALLAVAVAAVACGGRTGSAADLLDRARARAVPAAAQARFSGQLESAPLQAGGTGSGGVRVRLPDALHLEVFDGFGASRGRVHLEDGHATLAIPGRDAVIEGPEADRVLRALTGGDAGLSDVVGLFVGRLPLEHAAISSFARLPADRALVGLESGEGLSVDVTLRVDLAVPTRVVARDRQGSVILIAVYDGWHDVHGLLLPRRIGLSVPLLDIDAVLRVHDWELIP